MLTGLYNRTGFYNALETLPRRNDQLALVVSVDVDGLKYINDNFGHEAGDYAIRAAANAIDSVSIENKSAADLAEMSLPFSLSLIQTFPSRSRRR